MDQLLRLSTGAKIVLGGTIAFLIVSFFNWQEVSADLGPIGTIEAGVSMWHGVGVIAGLIAIALLAWQVLRLANINIDVGISSTLITAALAALLVVFAVLKIIIDNEQLKFWAILGVIFAAAVAVGAWMNMQAAGESFDDVRKSISGLGGSGSGSAHAPPASPPPASTPPTGGESSVPTSTEEPEPPRTT